ncbi:head GIN domain-containing protein [Putridiphycobacter roseus]|nr:head GIN domain-containing protein [Putridiphycobacter roseus]
MMQKIFTSIILILLTFTTQAGQFEQTLGKFNKVKIIGNYEVNLIQGDVSKIVVDNKDAKVPDEAILFSIIDTILTVQLQYDTYVKRNLTIDIYYQELIEIEGKRGVRISCQTPFTNDLSLFVNAGGKIDVKVNTENLLVKVSSGGSIHVDGKVTYLKADVNAGGLIGASFLLVETCAATVQMGGEIILNVTNSLVATVKAGGVISYKGNPVELSKSIKLGGTIEKL